MKLNDLPTNFQLDLLVFDMDEDMIIGLKTLIRNKLLTYMENKNCFNLIEDNFNYVMESSILLPDAASCNVKLLPSTTVIKYC